VQSKLSIEAFEDILEEFPESGKKIMDSMEKTMEKYEDAKEAVDQIKEDRKSLMKTSLSFQKAAKIIIGRKRRGMAPLAENSGSGALDKHGTMRISPQGKSFCFRVIFFAVF